MMPTHPPTHALSPVIPINARALCITAAAGTELAGPSFESGHFFPEF